MKDYDAIVIGSGIGGLSCAGILADSGLRVLVVEKNPNPGGYLTSFKKKGVTFDSAVDCFSGVDEKGAMRHLLKVLDMEDEIEFIRIDPIRESIFPGLKIKTWSDINAYIENLKILFPSEKNIDALFEKMKEIYGNISRWTEELIHTKGNGSTLPSIFLKYLGITYRNLLDDYLHDERLKAVLCDRCSFLGLPPSRISAVSMVSLLMSYFTSGAYRPKGGCQKLSDVLTVGIKKKGGHVVFKKEASEIITDSNKSIGVMTTDGDEYTAEFIVSNIDYIKTLSMLDNKSGSEAQEKLNEYGASTSFFILYVGAKIDLSFLGGSSSIGYFPSFDMERAFDSRNSFTDNAPIGLTIPTMTDISMSANDCHSIVAHQLTDYQHTDSWKKEKQRLSELVIKNASKIIPDIKGSAVHIESATPATLERYTGNFRGAAYGWNQTPWLRPVKTGIENLYLAGHWAGLGGGIIAAVYSGFKTAKEILGRAS